jgi:hypothetical protein
MNAHSVGSIIIQREASIQRIFERRADFRSEVKVGAVREPPLPLVMLGLGFSSPGPHPGVIKSAIRLVIIFFKKI